MFLFFVYKPTQAPTNMARCNADHVDFRRLCRPTPAQGTDVATWCPEGADPSRHGRVEGHTHFGRRPPTDQSNSGDFSSYLEKVPGTWCTSCYPGRHLGPSLVTLFGPIPGSIAQATIARYQAASTGRASLTSSRHLIVFYFV